MANPRPSPIAAIASIMPSRFLAGLKPDVTRQDRRLRTAALRRPSQNRVGNLGGMDDVPTTCELVAKAEYKLEPDVLVRLLVHRRPPTHESKEQASDGAPWTIRRDLACAPRGL